MPPRQKRTQSPSVPAGVTSVTSDADDTDTTDTPKVKPIAVIKGSFNLVKADEVAVPVKHRPRTNPFDQPVAESYKENLEAADQWVSFTTDTEAVDDQVRLIRASANFLNIGCRVKVGADNDGETEIFFRGQERKTRKPRVDKNSAETTAE